jgi:hypothetical protein
MQKREIRGNLAPPPAAAEDPNLTLEFAVINFGDSTGSIVGRSRDYRGKKIKLVSPEK